MKKLRTILLAAAALLMPTVAYADIIAPTPPAPETGVGKMLWLLIASIVVIAAVVIYLVLQNQKKK